jgi:hypothetical protein
LTIDLLKPDLLSASITSGVLAGGIAQGINVERLVMRGRNRYAAKVKTKAIVAGAVVLALLLSAILLSADRGLPPQPVTVRHVGTVLSEGVTQMTFEITNHTVNTFGVYSLEIQVRDGNSWRCWRHCRHENYATLTSRGNASFTVNVANLPDTSIMRFLMSSQRILSGLNGFVKCVEWDVKTRSLALPLIPFDSRSAVYGDEIEVVSKEWVETVK